MQVKKMTGPGNKEIMLKADNRLFGRMLLIACLASGYKRSLAISFGVNTLGLGQP
jgi:hypothetical protein